MPARDEFPALQCPSNRLAPCANPASRGATSGVRASARMPSITTSRTLSIGGRGSQRSGATG